MAGSVVNRVEQRRGGREQAVEEAALGVEHGLDVGHAPIAANREVRDVAAAASDAIEERTAALHVVRDLVGGRLEVVEKVELEIIDEAAGDFVGDAVLVRIVVGALAGGASRRSSAPSSTMPDGVTMRPPALAAASSGSTACNPISSFNAPTTNSRIENLPPCAKNGRTRRSGSTPATRDTSTVPFGNAVRVP